MHEGQREDSFLESALPYAMKALPFTFFWYLVNLKPKFNFNEAKENGEKKAHLQRLLWVRE